MHFNSTAFDPFLRVSAKKIRTTSYGWLVDAIKTRTGEACIIWPFSKNVKGYGILAVDRKAVLAHRVAFELANGREPKGCVVQTCGDRLCIAPQHLIEQAHATPHGAQPKPFGKYRWLLRQIVKHQSDDCLLWPYASIKGLGRVTLPDKSKEYVHIVAFTVVHKRRPNRRGLRQSCGNKGCFNWRHLTEGPGIEETRLDYLLRVIPTLNDTDCAIWPFAVMENGYGFFHLRDGSKCLTHRMAYKIRNGHFPKNHGAHSCHTPACFNPAHIHDATAQQNIDEKIAAGRQPTGGQCYQAILSVDQVRAIRSEYIP